ncbi:MAG: helicase [Microbacterium sp.]|uniref:Rv3654c family TadE-like protein n=1 Tax=Microbacterium sp. TaxID=51671 RepID=UPI0039E658EA
MAGVVVAVGTIAASALLTMGLAGAAQAAVWSQRLAGAADAAALAAADAASGAVPGYPCERAGELAEAAGARLADCVLDGLIVTITVRADVLGLPAVATARAGPAP